jgi:hypothetical protein
MYALPADGAAHAQDVAPANSTRVYLPLYVPPVEEEGPDAISLRALPSQIPAVVTQRSFLRATVTDGDDMPLSDIPVEFAASSGRFANGDTVITATTDEDGIATVNFYALPIIETLIVEASTSDEVKDSTSVEFVLGDCNDTNTNDVANQAEPQPSAVCLGYFEDEPYLDNNNRVIDDWYEIVLQPGQTLEMNLDDVPFGADYDVAMFEEGNYGQPDGSDFFDVVVAVSLNPGTESEEFTYTNDEDVARTFHMQVAVARLENGTIGLSDTEIDDYRLSVVRDPVEPITDIIGPVLQIDDPTTTMAEDVPDPLMPVKPLP